MGKTFDWCWIWIPFTICILIFLLSWAIFGVCYNLHFDLVTEMANYSELTLPIGLETYYSILAAQLGAIMAGYITVPIFIIGIILCWIADLD